MWFAAMRFMVRPAWQRQTALWCQPTDTKARTQAAPHSCVRCAAAEADPPALAALVRALRQRQAHVRAQHRHCAAR